MTNNEIKDLLLHHARELDRKGASIFQVRAYRAAALVIQGLPTPVEVLLERNGRRALERIPGIGRSIASAIDVMLSLSTFRASGVGSDTQSGDERQVA
ncbi:MAG: helix-hairpin-helix domain-containing protein [Gemmataceae bacterium]